MAPKNKFTKEEMVTAALHVVREKGIDGLTAKTMASARHAGRPGLYPGRRADDVYRLLRSVARGADHTGCAFLACPPARLAAAFPRQPRAMQKIVSLFPLTQGITMMKNAFIGADTGSMLLPGCVMLGLTALCTVLSIRFFRWE